MAAPGVLALLTTSAPDEPARLRALALFGAVSSGGMSLGLLLGGFVTDIGSWRWTLFINVPIGLAILALTRRFVDETPRRPGRFDFVGAFSATAGAVALVWTLIGAPEHGWASARTVLGFAAGAALLALLAVTERRVAHPLLRPALLRSRRRVGGLAAIGLVVGGAAVDVLPRRAVHRGRARLRPDGLRARVPAADPRHLRDVAGHPRSWAPSARCR